jgi:hypothetical protein
MRDLELEPRLNRLDAKVLLIKQAAVQANHNENSGVGVILGHGGSAQPTLSFHPQSRASLQRFIANAQLLTL